MLNDSERRTLAEMEQRLALQDPVLDARLAQRQPTGWRRWWPTLAIVLGAVLIVGLLTLGLVGQAATVVALGATTVVLRRWHRDSAPPPGSTDSPAQDT